MKLNDWDILHCVWRSRKGFECEKGSERAALSVDIVPLDPVKSAVQKWQKIVEKKQVRLQ